MQCCVPNRQKARLNKQTAYEARTTARVNQNLPPISRFRKKVIFRVMFYFFSGIDEQLASYPSGSRASFGAVVWSLAKAVEGNFCHSSLVPLRNADGSLADTVK